MLLPTLACDISRRQSAAVVFTMSLHSLAEFYDACMHTIQDTSEVTRIIYPEWRNPDSKEAFLKEWKQRKAETEALNTKFLDWVHGSSGIYALYVRIPQEGDWTLKYIGHSVGSLSRQRLKNHLIDKNAKTGAKLAEVQETVWQGGEVAAKYIEISPPELRLCVECNLIERLEKGKVWNKRGLRDVDPEVFVNE